ncbi:MAG: FtsQ-type POTRA domain-containing protein [Rickettsiaceae bacterium]|nr:FtsQ-type POTRA domain-containing protein [Rickettsiaceae bacterium]
MKNKRLYRKNTVNKKASFSLKRRLLFLYTKFTTLVKLLVLIVIILAIFSNYFNPFKMNIWQKFYQISANHGFVIENVIIDGQQHTSSSDIVDAINASKGEAIFAVDIKKVKKRLEGNRWIKVAEVQRRLPNSLYITILEKEPIAIWQFQKKLYIIDREGKRISSKNIKKFKNLLHIVGEGANIYAATLIDDLAKHPTLASKVNVAVRYGQRRWNLNLEQNITVKMPADNFRKAYDYLYALNKKNKLFNQRYKIIDLRNPKKYYIEKYKNK